MPTSKLPSSVPRELVRAEFHYLISGLRVQSDIELRSASPTDNDDEPDVRIFLGTVPKGLDVPASQGFRLQVESVGAFAVYEGRQIVYEPASKSSISDLPIYLTGTCLAAILLQRGHLVLHASAVSVDGLAMLFCGESGAGKSTLAAMLVERGHLLLNDDVCHLEVDASGTFRVSPDGRMLKLWANTLEKLQKNTEGQPIRQGYDKFYSAASRSEIQQRPVGAIYILELAQTDEAPSVYKMDAASRMIEMRRNAYRGELVDLMDQRSAHFQATAALCSRYPVYRLRRSKDLDRAVEVVDLLESLWADEGLLTVRQPLTA